MIMYPVRLLKLKLYRLRISLDFLKEMTIFYLIHLCFWRILVKKRSSAKRLNRRRSKTNLSKINTNTPIGLRNKAIIELFYSSGIRTSELANLRIQDIDFKQQIATIIRGKGNKTRIVPVGMHACYYIEQYLLKARKFMLRGVLKDDGYYFYQLMERPLTERL